MGNGDRDCSAWKHINMGTEMWLELVLVFILCVRFN